MSGPTNPPVAPLALVSVLPISYLVHPPLASAATGVRPLHFRQVRGIPALVVVTVGVFAVAACVPPQPSSTGTPASAAPALATPSPSPSPTTTILIADSKALLEPPGADYCRQGGQVHFQWTVTGARQGDILLVNFSGFANQNNDNIPIPLDVALTASKIFPFVGPGVWRSHVVSVAGIVPIGSIDNMASVTCS